MPKRFRKRRLWLRIIFRVPSGVSMHKVARTLIDAIEEGDYKYPKSWKVYISWKNSAYKEMKTPGEFTKEMKASAKSSRGWDEAVLAYLRSKL